MLKLSIDLEPGEGRDVPREKTVHVEVLPVVFNAFSQALEMMKDELKDIIEVIKFKFDYGPYGAPRLKILIFFKERIGREEFNADFYSSPLCGNGRWSSPPKWREEDPTANIARDIVHGATCAVKNRICHYSNVSSQLGKAL